MVNSQTNSQDHKPSFTLMILALSSFFNQENSSSSSAFVIHCSMASSLSFFLPSSSLPPQSLMDRNSIRIVRNAWHGLLGMDHYNTFVLELHINRPPIMVMILLEVTRVFQRGC